jgi:hypothetical protein
VVKTRKAPARARSRLRARTIADRPDCDIPFQTPPALPPGVHVAPFLSWTGEPLLLVIDDKGEEELAVRMTEVRALQHRKGDYEFPFVTPKWLGQMARPWHRGVWRAPFTIHGGRQYFAIDAHGRMVAVKYLKGAGGTRAYLDPQNEAEAVAACRAALRAEDPVVRPRPRGESRW